MSNRVEGAASPSFVERKAAQLRQERADEPEQRAAPENRPPALEPESEDVTGDIPEEDGYADSDDEQDDQAGSAAALEDEQPEAEDLDAGDSGNVDWEKRYADLRSETDSILSTREDMAKEHAQSMTEHARLRYELEDTIKDAVQRADFLKKTMGGNADQYRNINWAQVPPDKVQEVQQQAQQAFALEQQAANAYEQYMTYATDALENNRRREAEIAKIRLKRTVPNWGNEVYGQIREFAVSQGMDEKAFNEITDPVLIEWAYNAMQAKQAGSKVQTTTRRKAQPPRGRNARRQPRDERGQFASKQTIPNQKGSFAEKHAHRLRAERTGR